MTEQTSFTEFPFEHFSLQYKYAMRATEVSPISIEQALIEFTQFWRRVHNLSVLRAAKTEWSFDSTTPEWQELCRRINTNEPADTVAFDLYNKTSNSSEIDKEYFGCFRYTFDPKVGNDSGVITIHFKNKDVSGKGPLSKERQQERLNDLKQMFEAIRKHHPEVKVVRGGSWLYNLESYCRLFPKIFTTGMKVEEIPFPRTSGIWGQFLNSEGEINEEMKNGFLDRISNAKNLNQLLQCFKFNILFAKTEIENFYSHLIIL